MTLLIAKELNFLKEIFLGQWSIILRDNPAGHCFVLRNLVPMSFLLLKMFVPENKNDYVIENACLRQNF